MSQLLEPLINGVVHLVNSGGPPMVFFLMLLESACIPVPSEVIMLFAGYMVYRGDASMVGAVAAGVVGNVVGSVLCWWVGWHGGRPLVDRFGRYVRLNHHHLDRADRFFERWGPVTVFVGRILPIVRTFISLPAGLGRMRLAPFVTYTTLGCIPWVWLLTYIGVKMGPNWKHAQESLHNGDYVVIAAAVIGIAWLGVRRRRAASAPTADASAELSHASRADH